MLDIIDCSTNKMLVKNECTVKSEDECISPPASLSVYGIPSHQDLDRLRQFAEIATSSSCVTPTSLHSKLLSSLLYSSLLQSSAAVLSSCPPQDAPMDLSLSSRRDKEVQGQERRDSVGSNISTGSLDSESDRLEEVSRPAGYWCSECGKNYSSSSNLARHKQSHRVTPGGKKCGVCSREYSSPAALAMHMRTHGAGCECHYCGKSFSRPWLLQGHIRTHTGEKPFTCTVCNKSFADKSNLRAHTQTHSTDKPFACGNCGKAFALKSYLSKHEESSCFKKKTTTPQRRRQASSEDLQTNITPAAGLPTSILTSSPAAGPLALLNPHFLAAYPSIH